MPPVAGVQGASCRTFARKTPPGRLQAVRGRGRQRKGDNPWQLTPSRFSDETTEHPLQGRVRWESDPCSTNPSGIRLPTASLTFEVVHRDSPLPSSPRSDAVFPDRAHRAAVLSLSLARKRSGVRISSAPRVMKCKASNKLLLKRC
jgi:hypothetical protein